MRRRAEAVFLVLAVGCWAAKVAVDSGAPAVILTAVSILAALAAVAAVLLGGPPARWLDAGRLSLGLAVLEAMLRRLYGPAIALLATLAIWWATPLFFYAIANPSMSHGASAFLATLFVAAWLRFRGSHRPAHWALLGAAGALLSLVR